MKHTKHLFYALLCTCISMCFCILPLHAEESNNGKDLSNEIVTSFILSDKLNGSTSIDNQSFDLEGGDISVYPCIKFNFDSNKVHDQDYVLIKWPSQINPTTNGNVLKYDGEETVDFKVNDTIVGKTYYTTNQAKIVFNENINHIEEAYGYCSFRLDLANIDPVSYQNTNDTLSITCGDRTQSIQVHVPTVGTQSKFFQHSAIKEVESTTVDELTFNLDVNGSYSEITSDAITIKTTLSNNHELIDDSFSWRFKREINPGEYNQDPTTKPEGVKLTKNKNSFTLTLPKECFNDTDTICKHHGYTIKYKTKITDKTNTEYTSTAIPSGSFMFYDESKDIKELLNDYQLNASTTLKNDEAQGIITINANELKVSVIDDVTKQPIPNVTIDYMYQDQSTGKLSPTDNEGLALKKDLTPGYYKVFITEENTPEGYDLNSKYFDTEVFDTNQINTEWTTIQLHKTIKPDSITSIPVKVIWIGEPTNTTINLLNNNDQTKIDSKELSKDEHNTSFEQIKEIELDQYTVDQTPLPNYETTIEGNSKTGYTITNTKKYPFTFNLQDGYAFDQTKEKTPLLKGSKLTITDYTENHYDEQYIIENGSTYQLIPGEYFLEQTSFINGYEYKQEVSITVNKDGSVTQDYNYENELVDTLNNTKQTITLLAYPESMDIPVHIVWLDENNQKDTNAPESIQVTLDHYGSINISSSEDWSSTFESAIKYINNEEFKYDKTHLTEQLNDLSNLYDVEITYNQEEGYTVTNTRKPIKQHAIHFNVYDYNDYVQTNTNLTQLDTTLIVTDLNKNTYTIKPNGTINLPAGTYTVNEQTTPTGYVSTSTIQFTIDEEGIVHQAALPESNHHKPNDVTVLNSTQIYDLDITINWIDHGYTHPNNVSIEVLQDSKPYLSKTIHEDKNHEFHIVLKDLPLYKNGKRITYTINEQNVPSYKTKSLTSKDHTFSITYEHKQDQIINNDQPTNNTPKPTQTITTQQAPTQTIIPSTDDQTNLTQYITLFVLSILSIISIKHHLTSIN